MRNDRAGADVNCRPNDGANRVGSTGDRAVDPRHQQNQVGQAEDDRDLLRGEDVKEVPSLGNGRVVGRHQQLAGLLQRRSQLGVEAGFGLLQLVACLTVPIGVHSSTRQPSGVRRYETT